MQNLLKNESSNSIPPTDVSMQLAIPADYICPLTKKIMVDPVVLAGDGYTYERQAVVNRLKTQMNSPVTGESLSSAQLIVNKNLKETIQRFFNQNYNFFKAQFIEAMGLGDEHTIAHLINLGMDSQTTDDKGWAFLHHLAFSGGAEKIAFWTKYIGINTNTAQYEVRHALPQEVENAISALERQIKALQEKSDSLKNELKGQDPYAKEANLIYSMNVSEDTLSTLLGHATPYGEVSRRQKDPLCRFDGRQIEERLNKTFREGYHQNWGHPQKMQWLGEKHKALIKARTDYAKEVQIIDQNIAREKQKLAAHQAQLRERIEMLRKAYIQVFSNLTPLHLAILANKREVVSALLQNGANLSTCGKEGETPLFCAVCVNNLALVKLLIQHGANTQVTDLTENTLLHVAAQYAGRELIDYLFEIEFLYQMVNKAGYTPAKVAVSYERQEIARHIEQQGRKQLQSIFQQQRARQQSPITGASPLPPVYAHENKRQPIVEQRTLTAPSSYPAASLEQRVQALSLTPTTTPRQLSSPASLTEKSGTHYVSSTSASTASADLPLPPLVAVTSISNTYPGTQPRPFARLEGTRVPAAQKGVEKESESRREREGEYNTCNFPNRGTSNLGSAHLSSSQFFTAREMPPSSVKNETESSTAASSSFEVQHNQITFQKVIGRGSYGTVHQALYQGKTVAVKVLTDQEASQKSIQEFRVEITLMRTLNSPYVVKVLGACLEYPHHSMILEYLPKGTLYALLSKEHSPEWDQGWNLRYQIALDIAQGLNYLHNNAIVHGDFKSPNILLDENYRAKISDFGLAKIKQSTTSSTVIGGGTGGSILWMAPELFKRDAKSTKYSDIFSFSTVLWELGARKAPFEGTHQFAVPGLVMAGEREAITPDTPVSMARLISFGWRANPKDRLGSDQAVSILSEEHARLFNRATRK